MSAWRDGDGHLLLQVRLQPAARRSGIDGLATLADGREVLKVRVTAAAEGGKANAALTALLARTWRLAKRDIELIAGRTSRSKTLRLHGDPAVLRQRLSGWLAGFE